MSETTVVKKPSTNTVQLNGTIKEINLAFDANAVNKNNPKLKGAIMKKEFKNPAIVLDCNGNLIGVEVMPAYKMKEENGSLKENPRFKALETVMAYEPNTRVNVRGTVSENLYVNDQLEDKSITQIQAFQISSTNVSEDDSSDMKLGAIVRKIAHEIKDEQETGNIIVTLEYLSKNVDGGLDIHPLDVVVEEDLADDFQSDYGVGTSAIFDIEIKTQTVGTVKKTEGHFGRRDTKVVSGYSRTYYDLFGADAPLEEENEQYISIDDAKKYEAERAVRIEALKADKKNGSSSKGSTEKKGLGNRKSTVDTTTSVDDDPFA